MNYFIVIFDWLITLQCVPKLEAYSLPQLRQINDTKNEVNTTVARRHGGGGEETDEDEMRRDNETTEFVRFGPTWGPKYHPHYGYEPYWEDGAWTNRNVTKAPSREELAMFIAYNGSGPTPMGYRGTDNCPIPCPKIYSDYGIICARDSKGELKTFHNYCYMLYDECAGIDPGRGWTMIYKHKCWDEEIKLELYEHKQEFIYDRVEDILQRYKKKSYTTITPELSTSIGMKAPFRRALLQNELA